MSERKSPRHPLFDLASAYSRMRKSVRPEYKMRGYFHWQKARAIRLGIPLLQHEDGRPPVLRDLASQIGEVDAGALRVTDALDVSPVSLPRGTEPLDKGIGSLVLVREANGAQSVGLCVRLDRVVFPSAVPCRAFLIEPEVLARLQDVVQRACEVGPDGALPCAFATETVAGHLEVARLLSAIPDLDGEAQGNEICFHRLSIASEFDTFPPRQGPLTVVLVFDDPAVLEPVR